MWRLRAQRRRGCRPSGPGPGRAGRGRCARTLALGLLAPLAAWAGRAAWSALAFAAQAPRSPGAAVVARRQEGHVACQASVVDNVDNQVKTVSDTIADFYEGYPQPPVLPLYRPYVIDQLVQLHLAVVDSRFKYDAIFALGAYEAYTRLMGAYDKIAGGTQTEKIWTALIKAIGLNPDKVKGDAETVSAWAKSTVPAVILKTMEGTEKGADERIVQAFEHIASGLYSMPFSIGLLKIMEYSNVDATRENAEEWAKALKIPPSKLTSDLDTYKKNLNKLSKAEEMMREVEIREKKNLAARLEAKAKALAEKAAAKADEVK